MEILCWQNKTSEDKARIVFVHHQPQILTEQERSDLLQNGFETEIRPEPPAAIVGKTHVLYCNPVTKELWYETEDRELTPEESQAKILEQQALILEQQAKILKKLGV